MKKLVIVGCILLLCCCISTVVGFGLLGYFEANGACAYKGPLSSAQSGACSNSTLVSNSTDTSLANSTDSGNMDTDFNTTDDSDTSVNTYIYNGDDYSLEYPVDFLVDDSDPARLFVYAANEADNLNISSKSLTITANQSNCQDYADAAIDELVAYDAESVSVSVVNVGGYKACRTEFTADYGTDSGRVNQTQYYVAAGSTTYFLTITINQDESNFADLEDVATSIQFN